MNDIEIRKALRHALKGTHPAVLFDYLLSEEGMADRMGLPRRYDAVNIVRWMIIAFKYGRPAAQE
jgi:hypothetical protein